jgi:cell shape-determining protein MreD
VPFQVVARTGDDVRHASGRPPCAGSVYSQAPRADIPREASRREPHIDYTSILLAILVGIVHAGLAPVLVVGGVKPNLVLAAVVLVTTTFGFGPGIVWAFVAGVVANVLIPEPLGSVPLALLAVVVVVSAGARLLGRVVWVYPIAAAFVASILADLVSLGALSLVGGSLGTAVPLQLLVPAAVLNAAITGLLLVPTRILLRRYGPEENPAW